MICLTLKDGEPEKETLFCLERKEAGIWLFASCVCGGGGGLTGQDHELVGGVKCEGDTTRLGE